jgi:hypothetical protein
MLLNDFLNDPQKMGMLSIYLMQQAQGGQPQQQGMGMQLMGAAQGLAGLLNKKEPATGDPLPSYLARANSQPSELSQNWTFPKNLQDEDLNIPQPENYKTPYYNPDVNNQMPRAEPDMQQDPNTISRIASAIGQVESSGRYDALGQTTKSGDRAYGKYQIMGNNIPAWSKEVLGYSVTPQQFLADPQLQDKIAQAKMAQYHQKYGNAGDVASAWFSGRPLRNNRSRDITGTSVPDYVNRVYGYL